jgi:hypothetical protein
VRKQDYVSEYSIRMWNLFSFTININMLSINKCTLVLCIGGDVGDPMFVTDEVCGRR